MSLKAKYNPDANVPNPKDNKGNFTICRRCRSIYHWISDCPHNVSLNSGKSSNSTFYSKNEEDIHIALFQSCSPASSEDQITSLVTETFCHGVIDSGCSKTVAGKNWLDDYLGTLSEKDIENIEYYESSAIFRFGDSNPVTSQGKAVLPVVMGGKKVRLETEIVKSDIPLLLSKDTMKAAKAQQDYENDCISLFGTKQDMICTQSGHYAIPICSARNSNSSSLNEFNTVLYNFQNSTMKSNDETARKLHHQFAHPSSKRLINYIKNAGIDDSELFNCIENVTQSCNTCKRYKRPSPRPIVMFPLATQFNETVALDLKIYENNTTYFLHVIDHATRFSAAAVIKSKKSEVIVNNFFKIWIAIFGTPGKVLSDNGGEFVNSTFVDMCESLNINFITTAAESPWSNGLVERHNGIIGEVVKKILEEVDCSIEVALCWAVNAKNSLQNIYGYSSYQLVFGKNPTLPSVLTNRLPALEGVTGSKLIADHLNALHQARQEVIKLEASEKIRRALKAKTRTHNNIRYLPGDEVFFKREGEDRWKGPAKVIGQDGSKILVKTPNSLISVHSCRVCLTADSENEKNLQLSEETQNLNEKSEKAHINDDENKSKTRDQLHVSQEYLQSVIDEDDDDNISKLVSNSNEIPSLEITNETPHNTPADEIATLLPSETVETVSDQAKQPTLLSDTTAPVPDNLQNDLENSNLPPPRNVPLVNENQSEDVTLNNTELPKNNQCVKYRLSNENEWANVKILKRAGKASGKYHNWLNVRNLDNEREFSIDWDQVSEWKPIEYEVFLGECTDTDKFEDAKQKELNNWKLMKVYSEVENQGQPFISVKWVYKEKIIENKPVKKARLVARGYEEFNSEILTSSPTCNKDSLRVVLCIIASKCWEINSIDIRAAFLQGKPIDRDIYLKPPKEAKAPGKLWKLNQCVYGLNDASRYWYMRVREELIKFNCYPCKVDPTVFYFYNPLEGIKISHVDDFLWAGTERFKSNVIQKMKTTFSISEENSTAFKYVGIEIFQDSAGIYINQRKYTNELKEINIEVSKRDQPDLSLNENEKKELRSVIGKLNWLATQTRPDLSYNVSILASCVKNASIKHLHKANKLIKQCTLNNVAIYFPKMNIETLKVRCYADASYGKLPDGGSQGGLFIELCDSENITCPIFWQSKRIHRVVSDVMAAEALAMKDALDAGFLVKSLVEEILYQGKENIPLEALTDSKALHEAVHSTKAMQNRRLRIDLSIIREYILNEQCEISWVQSKDQLADILTKDGVDSFKMISHISRN